MASSWRILMRKGVRRKGGWSGWKKARGCGSKVSTAAAVLELPRQARASPITA